MCFDTQAFLETALNGRSHAMRPNMQNRFARVFLSGRFPTLPVCTGTAQLKKHTSATMHIKTEL